MSIIDDLKLYYKKVRRAKRIKCLKSKIAPYLQKDFGVELNYKLWTTKGARFIASERNKVLDNLSSMTVGYLSAYLIIINLVNIYDLPYLSKLTSNELGFTITAISVLILIFSQFENAKKFAIKSANFHQCSLDIGELYSELRMIKTFNTVKNADGKIKLISEKYDIILNKNENHSPIDFHLFKTTKPPYFGLNKFDVFWINIRAYITIKFKYHLMIYGPVVLFIYYQFSTNKI